MAAHGKEARHIFCRRRCGADAIRRLARLVQDRRPGIAVEERAIGPGLDFKADGGYVVLPPSRPDPRKGGYQWVNGSDLSETTEVPAEIVAALKRTPHERDFLEA